MTKRSKQWNRKGGEKPPETPTKAHRKPNTAYEDMNAVIRAIDSRKRALGLRR